MSLKKMCEKMSTFSFGKWSTPKRKEIMRKRSFLFYDKLCRNLKLKKIRNKKAVEGDS
jgi:hypothetical protein